MDYAYTQSEALKFQCGTVALAQKMLDLESQGLPFTEQCKLDYAIMGTQILKNYIPVGTVLFDYGECVSFISPPLLSCIVGNDDNLHYTATLTSSIAGLLATFPLTDIANASQPYKVIIDYFINALNAGNLYTAQVEPFLPYGMDVITCDENMINDTLTIEVTVTGWNHCQVQNSGGWSWDAGTSTATYSDTEAFSQVDRVQLDGQNCISDENVEQLIQNLKTTLN